MDLKLSSIQKLEEFKGNSSVLDRYQTHSVLCFVDTDATYQLILHSGCNNFIYRYNIPSHNILDVL